MLYRALGAPLVLLIDGITYLFSAFSASFIQIPQKLAADTGSVTSRASTLKQEIAEGFRYVRADAGLSQLLLVATSLNFLIAPMLGLFPFFVEDHLKLNPGWYGYLLAFYGVGNLVGFLIAGTVKVSSSARAGAIVGFMLLASVLYGLLGIAGTAWMAATLVAGIGASSGFMNVNIWSILQVTTPSDIRGRVFGLLQTVAACLLPIGMGLAGLAASLLGKNIALIYIVCGICMGLVTLVASLLDDFRRYLAYDTNKREKALPPDEVPTLERRIHEGAGAD
jgi:MFS family permease